MGKFVTFEISKKLKEIGYDEITRFDSLVSLYNKEGKHTLYANYGVMYSGLSDGYINAPLWQEVFDWFRNDKKILIEVFALDSWDCWGISIYLEDLMSPFYIAVSDEDFKTYEEARETVILQAIKLISK